MGERTPPMVTALGTHAISASPLMQSSVTVVTDLVELEARLKRRCRFRLHARADCASSQATRPHCIAHGGGRRCLQEGCSTGAADGGPQYCIAHGGGRRCQKEGCTKAAASGGTPHCIAHGGGRRCQHADCFKSVAKAAGSVFCYVPAWRGQARAAAAAAARRCADEWFVQTLARD
jgi:hypothetical protein